MSSRYAPQEFDVVAYMASSGGLGCPDSDARSAYYGVGGIPDVVFAGVVRLVGAGADAVNGSVYDPVVQSLLDDATPVKLDITDYSFDLPSPHVSFSVELEAGLGDISRTKLRIGVLEDGLYYPPRTHNDVLRDMLPDVPLTIDQAGQVQTGTVTFAVDPAWIKANLRLIAFVQDDFTKHIHQMATTRPGPDRAFRYYALGDRVVIDQGEVGFDDFAIFNSGTMADTYTVSIDASGMPPGWSAWIHYNGSDYTTLDLALAPDERAVMNVVVDAAGAGGGDATLTMHAQSGVPDDRQLVYSVITPDTEILLVDDDGAFDYETRYYAPALATTGHSFGIWNRNAAALSGPTLSNFDVVVWPTAFAFPTVDADDRAAIASYLDGGGRLFITGQDIGWEMNDIGGSAVTWYHNYLHATYIADDTNNLTLTGVAGDPIGDGLSLAIAGGDGAGNQDYPSDIDPRDAFASTVFQYDATRNGAIKADTGVHRVVYFSFGYEAIDNATDRAIVMQRVIDWLAPGANDVPAGAWTSAPMTLGENAPNPFGPRTDIDFTLGRATEIELAVFDVQGRLVRVLASGPQEVGVHRVTWDGRDAGGHDLGSGVYFYRLKGPDGSQARKMLLMR